MRCGGVGSDPVQGCAGGDDGGGDDGGGDNGGGDDGGGPLVVVVVMVS